MAKIIVNQDLRNCTSSVTTPDIEVPTDSYRIDFVANTGYEFEGRNSSLMKGSSTTWENLVVSPDYANIKKKDKQNGFIEFDSLKLKDDTKDGILNLVVPTVQYFEESTLILELENCSIDYNKPTIPTGRVDLSINVIADENCIFEEEGYWIDSSKPTKRNGIMFYGSDTSTSFTIQVAKGEFITIHLTAKSLAPEPEPQATSFVQVFRPNEDELLELSKKRFPVGNPSSPFEVTDFGIYITQLFRTPFKIPDEIIGDKKRVFLGNLDSLIDIDSITSENYIFNLGKIEIPEVYGNVYDYINTTCLLHVPFTNPIELRPEYVINHVIMIEYVINVYDGNSTINIYSDFTDNIVYSETTLTGTKIPFMQVQNNTFINQLVQPLYNGITRCYIEIIRNIPYDSDNIFGKPTLDYGKLSKYQGYIEVGNIILNTKATQQEKEEIKDLLQQGVYINA